MKRRPGRRKPKSKIRLAGDPILSIVCEPVKPEEDVSHIIKDMMYILVNSKNGVGLSANQAGYKKRIIIARINGRFRTFINPKISDYPSLKMVTKREGCLSYPKVFKDVARHVSIGVWSGSDVEGWQIFDSMEARIIQHEVDHLNGKCKVGGK